MRVELDVKLTFDDVLIRPKRSTLVSRSDVTLIRDFTTGTPDHVASECLKVKSRISVTSDLETRVLRLGLISTSSKVSFTSSSTRIRTLLLQRRCA
jgi:hypothetical protein